VKLILLETNDRLQVLLLVQNIENEQKGLHLQEGAIHVIYKKHPNGVVDQMVPGRSVMPADCIMRS